MADQMKWLNDARDEFVASLAPDREDTWRLAVNYLHTAINYWDQGEIKDDALAAIVQSTAPYIK